MCDYSMHNVTSRAARVGDRLVTTAFANSCTRGFAAVSEPHVAVCLRPGTEIAFEKNVEYRRKIGFLPTARLTERVARFCQINKDRQGTHHDAVEFPDGTVVLVNRLREGQSATVLQLPVIPRTPVAAHPQGSVPHGKDALVAKTSGDNINEHVARSEP